MEERSKPQDRREPLRRISLTCQCISNSTEDPYAFYSQWARKREVALVGTALAHVRNMVRGVTKGYTYKLKIVYAHFPVTVKVQDKERKLTIENFTGEKTPRNVKIVGSAKVKVVSDEVHVQGSRLQDVSQTAANIQNATKIKDKDQRVFLDGIYIFEKSEGM